MTKNFVSLVFLFLLFSVNGFSQVSSKTEAKNIVAVLPPISYAASYKNEKNALLIDIRTENEYVLGHLKGAKNIDYYKDDFKSQINKLDKNAPVYIYCHSGVRSDYALKIMQTMGFKSVTDLQGGIVAWKKMGYPTVK